jgi:hypothetical protein
MNTAASVRELREEGKIIARRSRRGKIIRVDGWRVAARRQLLQYSNTPVLQHSNTTPHTPIRRYADTPTRPYADPFPRPPCVACTAVNAIV